jgi:hypothetical protein
MSPQLLYECPAELVPYLEAILVAHGYAVGPEVSAIGRYSLTRVLTSDTATVSLHCENSSVQADVAVWGADIADAVDVLESALGGCPFDRTPHGLTRRSRTPT